MSAQALPIVFTSSAFDTSAVALAQNLADFDTDSTPSSPLPVLSTATVVGEASSTSAAQSVQNFSQLTFSGDIPLPSTWLLLMVALAAMAFVQVRGEHRRG